MSNTRTAAVLALLLPIAVGIAPARAQTPTRSAQTDARWLAWLGCWDGEGGGDTTVALQHPPGSAICFIPVAGSRSAEALTVARGKIVNRDLLDAVGGPHVVDGQGCRGSETVNWSPTGRRVYLRSDFTCSGGNKGASTAIYALSPTGEWLRIEEVRSGGGKVVTVERRRPTALLSVVPPEAARMIAAQQLAIVTARAAAASPMTTDEIVDAVQNLTPGVVRSWVLASDQHFDLDGAALSALTRADVPQSVVQAIMATTARAQAATATASAPSHDVDAYLSRPGYGGYANTGPAPGASYYPAMTTMYVCPPAGCTQPAPVAPVAPYSPYNGYSGYSGYTYVPYPIIYSAPFVNTRGYEPFRQSFHAPTHPAPHQPPPLPGPVGRRP